MILSQKEIREAVEKNEIKFDPPLQERQWGEASIDLRLGFTFTKLKAADGVTVSLAKGIGHISDTGLWQEKTLKELDELGNKETYTLKPNDFVLALTYERIWMPPHLIGIVEGRSTYARFGLSMHQTAPWIQPGWNGRITLEIRNSGPLKVELTPMEDMPCQLTFFQLTSELEKSKAYGARPSDVFQDQESAIPKMRHK